MNNRIVLKVGKFKLSIIQGVIANSTHNTVEVYVSHPDMKDDVIGSLFGIHGDNPMGWMPADDVAQLIVALREWVDYP